ncbi:hypothetical protein [Bizionia myxarmorum]|uniref:Uncharacterized protein n=1 Tax=Bizionia myxarmorum TaxID=291186 RepID=A0A5D0RFR2_9FLAO|nr:hypothetical protein [Bizionia myxarmorum]TYB79806.1 hypothetical protein ES674_08670 [Bizionia myxarmorum]
MSEAVENSLCQDCKFMDTCILTTNKSFIWSCSEFQISAKSILKNQSQFKAKPVNHKLKKAAIELI